MKLLAILILGDLMAFPTGVCAECHEPPAPRVDWVECDKQEADLEGALLAEAVLTEAGLSRRLSEISDRHEVVSV